MKMKRSRGMRGAAIGFASAVLAVMAPGARAAVQEDGLPALIAQYLDEARQDCPAGFQAKGAVEKADLTGDGRPGYIVNPHRMVCAGSPHLFGGDGPASIELFVTLPSGELVHTGGVLALGYRIEPGPNGGEAPVIAFQTHDEADRAVSIDHYRWDGRNFALLERRSMAAPPVDGPDSEYQQ
jgi:hypothetical protein